MKRSEIIAQFESECLPQFESIAIALRSRHPSFRIVVGAGSVGGNTAFQGHNAYIDCDREGSTKPEPNCVALEVCIRDLDRVPTLCSLGIAWGADGIAPCNSTDHLPDSMLWNEDASRLIHSRLPTLESELEFCLKAWENAYHGN